MSLELGEDITPAHMTPPLIDALLRALAGQLVVADHSFGSAPDPSKSVSKRPK